VALLKRDTPLTKCVDGQIFMFGLSAGFIPQFFKDQVTQILPYCDYVFANENEIKTWTESHGHTTTSIPEMATLLAQTPKKNPQRPRVVIVTQGTDPTIIVTANEAQDPQIQEVPVLAIESSKIVDTNGAG
jgi:adenosine kinase